MILTRRQAFGLGGGLIAALGLPPGRGHAGNSVEINMIGRADGSRVGFDPIGIRVDPGQRIRWVNRDPGNAHTATAYHPANFGRPRRIPSDADAWDSGYLLPEETFEVTLTEPGVYDYYCVPHEEAGMVGRIVVGAPDLSNHFGYGDPDGLPELALRAFPPAAGILKSGIVRNPIRAGA